MDASIPTVLIVGSGPAGLFAACELVRHGVKPRVVERRLAPHHETRGTGLQPAVLEIIDRGRLIEPFLRAVVRIRQTQLLGPGLQEIAAAKFAGIGCKSPGRVRMERGAPVAAYTEQGRGRYSSGRMHRTWIVALAGAAIWSFSSAGTGPLDMAAVN